MSFSLPIFPEGLASSVITTVWVGVFVVCFFNLRAGWDLSGLVVPGYLVPLLIFKPWAVVAILVEASVTYLIVWVFSEKLSKLGYWCSFFGRDRFFALFITGVIVRVTFDQYMFPLFADFLSAYGKLGFVYRGGLHSIGLIIVALTANQFWKAGWRKALFPLLVTLGCTLLIVRYGLMEFTNFRISEVAFLYEDIASSLLASPKSYIILIITAFMASRMNLLYGWEYSGIIIPALIALQWYYPWKIVSSFMEAGIVYLFGSLLLKSPFFANRTMAGARKILLFFNISFIYKYCIGFLTPFIFPFLQTVDCYGLGYMLPTLLAIKMHDRHIPIRLTRATIQTSFVAVLIATVVGFSLLYLPIGERVHQFPLIEENTSILFSNRRVQAERALTPVRRQGEIITRILREQFSLYGCRSSSSSQLEQTIFREAMEALRFYLDTGYVIAQRRAHQLLSQINYRMEAVNEHYLLITDAIEGRDWGTYLFARRSPLSLLLEEKKREERGNKKNLFVSLCASNLVMEIPHPKESPALVAAGLKLFFDRGMKAIAIAGKTKPWAVKTNVLRGEDSFFGVFHSVFARKEVVQLFSRCDFEEEIQDQLEEVATSSANYLWVRSDESFVVRLRNLFDRINPLKEPLPLPNFLIEKNKKANVGCLFLTESSIEKILGRGDDFNLELPEIKTLSVLTLLQNNEEERQAIDPFLVSDPPTLAELHYMDFQVLTPLLKIMRESASREDHALNLQEKTQLKLISFAASLLDYKLKSYLSKESAGGKVCCVVLENDNREESVRNWGTYIFRMGKSNPFVIEVPDNWKQGHKSFDLGKTLFQELQARALFLAEPQGLSLKTYRSKRTLFNLANQVILRERSLFRQAKQSAPAFTVVSLLPYDFLENETPEVDIYWGSIFGKCWLEQLSSREKEIYGILKKRNYSIGFVNGSPATIDLESWDIPQAKYAFETPQSDFVALWFTPSFWRNFTAEEEQ